MSTTMMSIKIDAKTKKEAQKLAADLGMNLSSLIRGYLKHAVKTRRVEFDLGEEPSEYLKKRIRQAEENYKKGNTSPAFKTAKEAIAWLEKQGI